MYLKVSVLHKEGKYMNTTNSKTTKRAIFSKRFKNLLERELISLGGGTGSLIFYQPKAPTSFDKYKNGNK